MLGVPQPTVRIHEFYYPDANFEKASRAQTGHDRSKTK